MIRNVEPKDIPRLKELHAEMGFDYDFPDLKDFVGVWVLTDENDVPVQALAARKTVEMFFLADKTWRTPGWRFEAFTELHLAAHKAVKALGFKDSHAWLPPQVEKAFGRRLVRYFGWVKSRWSCFAKEL